MSDTATTTLSSKGQVVIPEEIRVRLGLKAGAQFVVVGDRDVVILKMLEPPALKEFQGLVARARRAAKQAGVKSSDVAKSDYESATQEVKIVVDTNVLVSGLIYGGTPGRVLSAWTDGVVTLVVSPEILEEYRRVGLELAKGRTDLHDALAALLTLIAVHAIIVDAPTLPERVSDDPDDDKFLAAALASGAKLIVSGDKHLLRVSGWSNSEVLKARQFVDQYLADR